MTRRNRSRSRDRSAPQERERARSHSRSRSRSYGRHNGKLKSDGTRGSPSRRRARSRSASTSDRRASREQRRQSRSRSGDRLRSGRSRSRSASLRRDDRREYSSDASFSSADGHSRPKDRKSKKYKKSKKDKKASKYRSKKRSSRRSASASPSRFTDPEREELRPRDATVELTTAVDAPSSSVTTETSVSQDGDAKSFFARLKLQEATKQTVGTVHASSGPAPSSATLLSAASEQWECSKAGCGHKNSKYAGACNKCGAIKRMSEWR